MRIALQHIVTVRGDYVSVLMVTPMLMITYPAKVRTNQHNEASLCALN